MTVLHGGVDRGDPWPNVRVPKPVAMVEVPVKLKVVPLATVKVAPATPLMAKPPLFRMPLATVKSPSKLVTREGGAVSALPSVTPAALLVVRLP